MGCTCKGKNDCGYCNSMKSAYDKPKFKVGQTWISSTNTTHRIISIEPDLIVTRKDSKENPTLCQWRPDGTYWYGTNVKLVAEFREPRSREVQLFLYETVDGEIFWFTTRINSGYLLAQKTVTITEGEGMK